MKTFDELLDMSDQEKLDYLEEEVQKILERAEPAQRRKLEGAHWRIRAKVQGKTMNYMDIFREMQDSLHRLNTYLNGITS